MIENYFNPASHLIHCELNQIKRSDALIILSYLTLIAPAVVLCIRLLKGRVKENPSDLTTKKVDKVAQGLYQQGIKESDASKAVDYFKKASQLGYPQATWELGNCYLNGHGVDQNYALARSNFESAAKDDLPEAFCSLGEMALKGIGCEKSAIVAAEYYMQANSSEGTHNYESIVENLNADDKATLGLKIKNNKSLSKYNKFAFALFQAAASMGHVPSLNHLGTCLWKGHGVNVNEAEALKNFNLAAEKGYGGAHINLGNFHAHGHLGFKIDHLQAKACYQKAIDFGRNDGYYWLGKLYEGTDTAKARDYFEKGANLNEPRSKAELARMGS